MNRSVSGIELFETDSDYAAFEQILAEARNRFRGVRLCAYCLMPNHFHLVLWLSEDGVLSPFMQWLTATHTTRWRTYRDSVGRGHLYQSRFKGFLIRQDLHFLTVCRYVERNALRAGLARREGGKNLRAEYWQWGSLAARDDPARRQILSEPWPVERPADWLEVVNRPDKMTELNAVRKCVEKGTPFGEVA